MTVNKSALKAILNKSGAMIYFSQLDLLRILQRALRRTTLPLYFTEGFNPRVKISFSSGLKLGVSGTVEVIFYFTQPVLLAQLKNSLSPQLPEGLTFVLADEKP